MSQEDVCPQKGDNIIKGFLSSFSFFSILPLRAKDVKPNKEFYNVMLFTMPFVGLVLGLITLLAFSILSGFFAVEYAAFTQTTSAARVEDGIYLPFDKKIIE